MTTIALGLWMTVAHAVLGYPISDPRTDAFLNEALAGMVAALLGLSSLIARGPLRRIPVIAAMTGLWTMVAPAVVGYGSAVPAAQANGLAAGAMLILLASVIGVGRFRAHAFAHLVRSARSALVSRTSSSFARLPPGRPLR